MNFREFLKDNIVYLDGGMGTLLQSKGLKPGEYPEMWNITHPEVVKEIHKAYFDAGSNVVCTNTFGANLFKFSKNELQTVIKAAVKNAEDAKKASVSQKPKYTALDIGPTGKLLKPLGELDFEQAVSVFAETVKIGTACGADLIIIETMSDSYETKAALLAAKENSSLPVIVSNAYSEDGKLMTGASPSAMTAMLEGMGADAVGANCSSGPKQLRGVVQELIENASVPVIFKPNAGLPRAVDGKTVFDVDADEFAREIAEAVKKGVRIAGGCCGTTPEYIKALTEKTESFVPVPVEEKNITVVSSYTHAVKFGKEPVLIGERINPTGKKRFKEAILNKDMDYILTEGVNQQEKGVHILDVNVGLPDIDEIEMLRNTVYELQSVSDLPLQIDTSDTEAMEAALRCYNGKAMINSVNGKEESMEKIFPLVKKYGGLVVALTLDEKGIPETAEERYNIAVKILRTAEKYGIKKNDIIFDTLAMTVSADNKAALATVGAMKKIRTELGCHTSLGISNVSFGLPCRNTVNSVFFAVALENGLSAAIMNPYSSDMMKTYYTYKALKGMDANCAGYIEASEHFAETETKEVKKEKKAGENLTEDFSSELQKAVIKGFKDKAGEITKELLKSNAPLDIVQNEIIPALNIVGESFEKKKTYLPQLLMSAEAAQNAFMRIKEAVPRQDGQKNSKGVFVIATVKGDVHDIGKNIVKLILSNYGFDVVDLGKDVPPEKITETVVRLHAPLAGLSALMTTTVPSMEETIKLIKEKAPWCKTVVGGAVLTKDYAEKIGAHKYAGDAMETVRYAESVVNGIESGM